MWRTFAGLNFDLFDPIHDSTLSRLPLWFRNPNFVTLPVHASSDRCNPLCFETLFLFRCGGFGNMFCCVIFWLLHSVIVLVCQKMASEKDDSLQSISVQLNGQNYPYWSYVMKFFWKARECGAMLMELLLSLKTSKMQNLQSSWKPGMSKTQRSLPRSIILFHNRYGCNLQSMIWLWLFRTIWKSCMYSLVLLFLVLDTHPLLMSLLK